MRIVLLLPVVLVAACTVGEVGGAGGPLGGTPDGGGGAGTGCVNRITPPGGAHTHLAGGGSNKGLNCIIGGCHLNNDLGPNAPGYQFAGTIYANGTANPATGVTVRIRAGAMTLTGVSDADGNFSFPAGSLPGNFTATVEVTACPGVTPMVGQLVGGGGGGANSCNLCHAPGGTTTPVSF